MNNKQYALADSYLETKFTGVFNEWPRSMVISYYVQRGVTLSRSKIRQAIQYAEESMKPHKFESDMQAILKHIRNPVNKATSRYVKLDHASIYLRVFTFDRPDVVVVSNISVFEQNQGYTSELVRVLKQNNYNIMFECVHNLVLAAWLVRQGFVCIDELNSNYLWSESVKEIKSYAALVFKFVDSHVEESQKMFATVLEAQTWLKGQRESDFEYLSLFYSLMNDIGEEVIIDSYSDIMGFK